MLRLRLVVVGVCSLSARSQRSIGVKSKSGAGHCWGWLVLQLCPLSRDILRSSSANIHDGMLCGDILIFECSLLQCVLCKLILNLGQLCQETRSFLWHGITHLPGSLLIFRHSTVAGSDPKQKLDQNIKNPAYLSNILGTFYSLKRKLFIFIINLLVPNY